MDKNIRVNPLDLKGREVANRIMDLMNIQESVDNRSTSVIELTKKGPDDKVYAIVRENHEYYIKVTDKKENLISEDFSYIGGLMNKKDEAYGSYAKALKHLNLKFNSLNEAFGKFGQLNVFKNDNLVTESGIAGFSSNGGNGFTGAGNLEGNTEMYKEELEDIPTEDDDDVKLTEVEQAIDDMIKDDETEEVKEEVEEITTEEEEEKPEFEEPLKENHKLSIARALNRMDSLIGGLSEKKK